MAASPHTAALYPTARVRGKRMIRLPEKDLDWVNLDAALAEDLGRQQLGWFVGGYPVAEAAAADLARLDANPEGGVWVVAPTSREMARALFDRWPHQEHVADPPAEGRPVWRSRKVWVAIPEDLRQLLPFARGLKPVIAGVIVLDPTCAVYRTRGGTDSWGHRHYNDRPQHVVNFRAALDADGWQPPLLLLTDVAAKGVSTQNVARAFCLNGFQFVSGHSFVCRDAPIEND